MPGRRPILAPIGVAVILLMSACQQPTEPKPAATEPDRGSELQRAATGARHADWSTYHRSAQQHADNSRDCITRLHAAIHELLENTPNQQLQQSVALLESCTAQQTTVSGLLVANSAAQDELQVLQQRIYSRLVFPGYVDAVQEHPHSGIVQDIALPLSRETLLEQHGLTDEAEISLGLDVLGFLLQGQHRFLPELPARDREQLRRIQPDELAPKQKLLDHPQQRRRAYLRLASDIARDDARKQAALWQRESNRGPQQDAWPVWTRALANKQLQILDTAAPDKTVLAAWWDIWQHVSEQPHSHSLADILVANHQDSELRAQITAQLSQPDTDLATLRNTFRHWLLSYSTSSLNTAAPSTNHALP